MIWSKTSFKCFHEDGTIFKTINEEKISAQEEEDEFGNIFEIINKIL